MKSIRYTPKKNDISIDLPASKSESNRCLIIQALSEEKSELLNLSDANDTYLLQTLLNSDSNIIDCQDAGTTFRFLLAYFAFSNRTVELTGSERMKQRPIGVLVDALNHLGAEITYTGKKGYPPLKISAKHKNTSHQITIDASISSQYVSALLMIGPTLDQGLTIHLSEAISSEPYIDMTLALMEKFGVSVDKNNQTLTVPKKKYIMIPHRIEADWSSAAFFYQHSVITQTSLRLNGLYSFSLQGDRAIVEIMEKLGVYTQFDTKGAVLSVKEQPTSFHYNFSNEPDLAQAVITSCAMLGINSQFTGLKSLYIKETDRVHAIITELRKCHVNIQETAHGCIEVLPSQIENNQEVDFNVYEDHRMAMSLAPIASKVKSITLNSENVVRKSFPTFWNELKKCGYSYE